MSFLKVETISKKQGESFIVKDISFTQRAFQKIAIAGETGSGKTTLLKIIAGLIQPDAGIVFFEDVPVDGPDYQLVPGHPLIGYLSQHYELKNNYRVEELLEYANKLPLAEARALYAVCRIDHLVKRRTDQLSGGEKQRIALARLLVGSPKLLLLDEPYSNLDPIHKNILKSVVSDISEKLSVTCLLTSHDPMDTLSWADEIIVLKDGAIMQKDTPETVYSKPVNEYVAALFGTYYLFNAADADSFRIPLKSNAPGRRLFIRPGNLQITATGDKGAEGKVVDVKFWGTYYELEVIIAGKTIAVRTQEGNYKKGDSVYVSVVLDGEAWFL